MVVGLSIKERIVVGNLLPQQGNMISMRTVQRARENLSFSDEEATAWDIKIVDQGGGRSAYLFDENKAMDADIVLPSRAFSMVADALIQLDKASKIEAAHLSLWPKFLTTSEQHETE